MEDKKKETKGLRERVKTPEEQPYGVAADMPAVEEFIGEEADWSEDISQVRGSGRRVKTEQP